MFDKEIKEDLSYLIEKVPIVYKYTRVKNFEAMISNSSLLLKNPSLFNDPYDCYPDLISFENVPKDFRNNLIDRFRHLIPADKVNGILKQLENNSDIEITKLFRDILFPIEKSAIAVSCFSERYDNLLMWSHYSDSHKGLCVGFNLQKLYSHFKQYHPALIKVKYTDQFERISYFTEPKKAIINWFRIKSTCWVYEKEIRIVLTNLKLNSGQQISIPFGIDSIDSIFLGSKIEPENKNKILSIASILLPHVKLSKMKLAKDSFSLIPE